jgi:hypothetical protein
MKKKLSHRWTLQQCGPFGAEINNSTLHSKKFQHKPNSKPQARPYGLASKLQIRNSTSQSDARYSIPILKDKNFNTVPAQA